MISVVTSSVVDQAISKLLASDSTPGFLDEPLVFISITDLKKGNLTLAGSFLLTLSETQTCLDDYLVIERFQSQHPEYSIYFLRDIHFCLAQSRLVLVTRDPGMDQELTLLLKPLYLHEFDPLHLQTRLLEKDDRISHLIEANELKNRKLRDHEQELSRFRRLFGPFAWFFKVDTQANKMNPGQIHKLRKKLEKLLS